MKVRYSRRAIADLTDIADDLRERDPRAAAVISARIRASIERLGILPFVGQRTDDAGLRMLPYYVFYEVLGGEVVVHHIHHIHHGHRKPRSPGETRSR